MYFEDFLNLILGFALGFLICINFLVVPMEDENEKSCYQYYKDNNGYILDNCEKYEKKWSDFDEQKTKKK